MTDREATRTVSVDIPLEHLTLRKYSLRVLEGPDKGLERTFERRQIDLGTGPDCDFPLTDPTVSRNHARIEHDGHGFRLTDLGSKNGIFLGDLRVLGAYLGPQQRLRLGETVVLFEMGTETVDIGIARETRFGDLLGKSVEMRTVFAMLKRVAPTDATVLIEGESGTGKELVAEALHRMGPFRNGPFVVLDCSAVPRDLMESEIFGHVRGAFTGAVKDRPGAMVEAHGGTLFLDEIGELPLELQPKLLRALEKREVRPVGGTQTRKVQVRIVAATNRRLDEEVRAGNFREDLFWRLGVIRVFLPPLRKRTEDIPLLAEHFLAQLAARMNVPTPRLSYDTMERLKEHAWPGNVRELRNFLERSFILSGAAAGSPLPLDLPAPEPPNLRRGQDDPDEVLRVDLDAPFKDVKDRLVTEFERRYFGRLLRRTEGNVSKAARIAGIHRKSLEYLLRQLDLPRTSGTDGEDD
ncbi:sigma 54-dependent Fis family transcriptional regulator [Myxococcota bacterium]|nr:sigma 54-dependent Fis family transcriptional regulator [Myxococcota bacterium]